MTDWDAAAARWRKSGRTQREVNAMLLQCLQEGCTTPPEPPARGYAATVAHAVAQARAAITAGTPRHEAARAHGVPVRLWSRL